LSDEPRVDAPRATLAIITRLDHANAFGNVHGGVILRLADECGGLAVLKLAGGPVVVTAAIDAMTFLGPAHVGERLEVVAEVTYVGRTSAEARIDAYSEPITTGVRRKVATGYALYVALDDEGKPRPIPPLSAPHDEAALARQTIRLARRDEARG